MPRDEDALRAVAEQSAAVLAAAGLPRMAARVLMALMVADGGLTAAELCERLGVSAAAVSGGVRMLQSLALVRRIPQAGSRRDRYELPDDAWYSAFANERPIYGALAGYAESAAAAFDDGSIAAERVSEMAAFFRFLEVRLPEVMDEWRTRRATGGR